MGTCCRISFHLIPAAGTSHRRVPTKDDVDACQAVFHDYACGDIPIYTTLAVPRQLIDVGKFDWRKMMKQAMTVLCPGVVLAVNWVSMEGYTGVEYWLPQHGLAYPSNQMIPSFDSTVHARIIADKVLEEEKQKKVKASAEKKLAKLTPEERKAVGL